MKAKPVKCIALRTERIPAASWFDQAEQGQLTRSSHPMPPKSGSGRGLKEFQGVPVLRSGVWTWAFGYILGFLAGRLCICFEVHRLEKHACLFYLFKSRTCSCKILRISEAP